MITALTFLFKARDLSEKTFKAHFHVVPRAHHKLHLSASFIFKRKGPLCVEIGFTQTFLGKQNATVEANAKSRKTFIDSFGVDFKTSPFSEICI